MQHANLGTESIVAKALDQPWRGDVPLLVVMGSTVVASVGQLAGRRAARCRTGIAKCYVVARSGC